MVTSGRVLKYLINTSELGLMLGGLGGVQLYATVEASHFIRKDIVGFGAFLSPRK